MTQIHKISTLTVIAVLFVIPAVAQGPGAPPATPIDGGLSLLLAAGALYGLKRLKNHKK